MGTRRWVTPIKAELNPRVSARIRVLMLVGLRRSFACIYAQRYYRHQEKDFPASPFDKLREH